MIPVLIGPREGGGGHLEAIARPLNESQLKWIASFEIETHLRCRRRRRHRYRRSRE